MTENLPPLDRGLLGTFLKKEKERIALRNGKWIPKGSLRQSEQGRYDLVQELIGYLTTGFFDRVGIDCPQKLVDLKSGGKMWTEGPEDVKLLCIRELCTKYPCDAVKVSSQPRG
jgi:hypothetical protein